MSKWVVSIAENGYNVVKTSKEGTTDYGVFEKSLFSLWVGISEFIIHGDVVETPEGTWLVKHDKSCYNPASPTNN